MPFERNGAFAVFYSRWCLDQLRKAPTQGLQPDAADLTWGHFRRHNQAYANTVADAHPGTGGDKLKLARQNFDKQAKRLLKWIADGKGYPRDFANQIGLLLTFGTSDERITWLGGHPGSNYSSFEAEDSSTFSSLPPYNDAAAGYNRSFSFDDEDEAQEDPDFQDGINSVANSLRRTCFTDSIMKVTVTVVKDTKVREGPAKRRKVVVVNVILAGGGASLETSRGAVVKRRMDDNE